MKKLLLMLVMFSLPAWAAIARTGSCSAASTACNLSATSSGDLIIVFAFRSGSTTAPSCPSGGHYSWTCPTGNWTGATSTGGTTASFRAGCTKSDGTAGSDTWTNAGGVAAVSYSGTNININSDCSTTANGGTAKNNAKNSTTADFPALTMSDSSGNSWVAGFLGDSASSVCNPSDMSRVSATGTVMVDDTNAGVTAHADKTCTVSSSTWMSFVAEILAPQTPTNKPTKVEPRGSTLFSYGIATAQSTWKVPIKNPVASGDTIIVAGIAGGTVSSITDDQSGTLTIDKTQSVGGGNTMYIAHEAAANGNIATLTIHYTTTSNYNQFGVLVLNNIATGAADATCGGTPSGTVASCGSMTPTQADDYIVACHADTSGTFPGSIITYTTSGPFTTWDNDGDSDFSCIMGSQHLAAAINPTITRSSSNTGLGMVGAAYKTVASAGGPPGSGIFVQQIQHLDFSRPQTLSGTSFTFDFPCLSSMHINLIDLAYASNTTVTISNVTDTNGNSWNSTTKLTNSTVWVQHWYTVNATCGPNMKITLTTVGTPSATNALCFTIWAISGAATAPFDTSCNATGNSGASSGTLSGPSCSTAQANELMLGYENHDGETATSLSPGWADMHDYGVYAAFEAEQDAGIQHYYAASAGSASFTWTLSNYESGTAINNWAAQVVAFAPPSISTGSKERKLEQLGENF